MKLLNSNPDSEQDVGKHGKPTCHFKVELLEQVRSQISKQMLISAVGGFLQELTYGSFSGSEKHSRRF